MPYTVVIEKQAVTQRSAAIYDVSLLVKVTDGISDVFIRQITKAYNKNSIDLVALQNEILKELKAQWDGYVSEQNIMNSAALNTAISTMQTQATAYVNL